MLSGNWFLITNPSRFPVLQNQIILCELKIGTSFIAHRSWCHRFRQGKAGKDEEASTAPRSSVFIAVTNRNPSQSRRYPAKPFFSDVKPFSDRRGTSDSFRLRFFFACVFSVLLHVLSTDFHNYRQRTEIAGAQGPFLPSDALPSLTPMQSTGPASIADAEHRTSTVADHLLPPISAPPSSFIRFHWLGSSF
ncbi:hypothetical protein LXL04_023475 [Taraxacum kok-saghyz]